LRQVRIKIEGPDIGEQQRRRDRKGPTDRLPHDCSEIAGGPAHLDAGAIPLFGRSTRPRARGSDPPHHKVYWAAAVESTYIPKALLHDRTASDDRYTAKKRDEYARTTVQTRQRRTAQGCAKQDHRRGRSAA